MVDNDRVENDRAENDRAENDRAEQARDKLPADARTDPLAPTVPAQLRERLNRDLAVQGAEGQPSSQDSAEATSTEPVNNDGEKDGHANRRPDPTRAPAD
jgi:hypothetical protein